MSRVRTLNLLRTICKETVKKIPHCISARLYCFAFLHNLCCNKCITDTRENSVNILASKDGSGHQEKKYCNYRETYMSIFYH